MRVGHMWQAALSLQRALFHTNGQHLMGKKKKEGGGDEEKEETGGDRILESFLQAFFCTELVVVLDCGVDCSTVYHSVGIFRIVACGKQSRGGGSGSVQHTAAVVGRKDHQ